LIAHKKYLSKTATNVRRSYAPDQKKKYPNRAIFKTKKEEKGIWFFAYLRFLKTSAAANATIMMTAAPIAM